jgi:hypothetical protein
MAEDVIKVCFTVAPEDLGMTPTQFADLAHESIHMKYNWIKPAERSEDKSIYMFTMEFDPEETLNGAMWQINNWIVDFQRKSPSYQAAEHKFVHQATGLRVWGWSWLIGQGYKLKDIKLNEQIICRLVLHYVEE